MPFPRTFALLPYTLHEKNFQHLLTFFLNSEVGWSTFWKKMIFAHVNIFAGVRYL